MLRGGWSKGESVGDHGNHFVELSSSLPDVLYGNTLVVADKSEVVKLDCYVSFDLYF
jgi:hypothetical protein